MRVARETKRRAVAPRTSQCRTRSARARAPRGCERRAANALANVGPPSAGEACTRAPPGSGRPAAMRCSSASCRRRSTRRCRRRRAHGEPIYNVGFRRLAGSARQRRRRWTPLEEAPRRRRWSRLRASAPRAPRRASARCSARSRLAPRFARASRSARACLSCAFADWVIIMRSSARCTRAKERACITQVQSGCRAPGSSVDLRQLVDGVIASSGQQSAYMSPRLRCGSEATVLSKRGRTDRRLRRQVLGCDEKYA